MPEPVFKMNYQLWELLPFLSEEGKKELGTAIAASPATFYCPTGKHRKVIHTIANADANTNMPVVFFFANNSSGKTQLSSNILTNITTGIKSGWFDEPMFTNWKYPKVAWLFSTSTAHRDIIVPNIKNLLNEDEYDCKQIGSIGFDNDFTFINTDWKAHLFTTNQDTEIMESARVGLMIFDEPVTEAVWKVCLARMQMGCLVIFNLTPLSMTPYIDSWLKRRRAQKKAYLVHGNIYDTCMLRGEHGFIPPFNVDEIVEMTPMDERPARLGGIPSYFKELIFANFNEQRQFRNPSEFPIDLVKDYFVMGMDPHDASPSFFLWVAFKRNGRVIVFAELPEYDGVQEYWEMRDQPDFPTEARAIFDMEDRHGIVPSKRIADRIYTFAKHSDTTIARTLAKAGRNLGRRLVFQKSYSTSTKEGEQNFGFRKIRELFSDNDEDGEPNLIIYNTCHHLKEAITHAIRAKPTSKADMAKTIDGMVVVPKYICPVSVLRYCVCINTPWFRDEQLKEGDSADYEGGEQPQEEMKPIARGFVRKATSGTTNCLRATRMNRR